jgi:general secretion pathway protein D
MKASRSSRKSRVRRSAFVPLSLISAQLFSGPIPALLAQAVAPEPEKKPSGDATKPAAEPTTPGTNAAPNQAQAAGKPAESGDGAKDGAKPEGDKPNEEIQVSFQGADINMIVQWIAQTTGKSVIKHPQVNCQLTIVSSKKVTPREAVNLVYNALSLEGFTAVESKNSVLIVPEGKEPKTSPELADSAQTTPGGKQRLLKILQLNYVNAGEMKEKIKSMLSEKGTVEIDNRANQLFVTDYGDNLRLITDLVKVLDTDKPGDVSVRVIPLKNVNAQELVREIQPLYQKMSGKSQGESVEVSANERSNSLIILSSESVFRALEKVILALDTEDAQEKVVETFPLKNADAEDVAKQLKDLNSDSDNSRRYPFFFFSSEGPGKSPKKMNVVADRRRNTLIVQAPPNQMDGIKKMITFLDEPVGDETLVPKIYPLKYVSAVDIEEVLNELFLKKTQTRNYFRFYDDFDDQSSSQDKTVGRLFGKVRITSEPYSNAIIITANSKENLEAVEAVLKQLDTPSEAGESTFRINLKFAKAGTVATSINVLFARQGSPALRPPTPPNQQPQQQQPQQQQQQQSQNNFGLEQEAKDEGYFPWLGGQPDNPRAGDGRTATRQVSDLVGRVRVVADQRSNSLMISANVHFFPQVMKLIEDLDVPTAQVLIEARIVEVSSDFMDKLGVRWSPDGTKTFTADDFDNSVMLHGGGEYKQGFGGKTSVNNGGGAVATALSTLRSGVLDSSINMDFLVQFLRKNVGASVLAAPQINIEDNETGKLFVGSQVPFINNTQNTGIGGLTQSFSYKDVGIILEVIPHINTSGDVALKIRAESSSIVPGQTLFGGAIVDTRSFKTDVTAKNGQTLVLGGIIQRQVSDTTRKVPGLGSIPGLGWAFKKKDKVMRDVELLVFLRPHVVRSEEEAKALLDDVDQRSPAVKQWREESEKPAPLTPEKK